MFKLVMAMLCFVMALAACAAIVTEADEAPGKCWVCIIKPPAVSPDTQPAVEPKSKPKAPELPTNDRPDPLFDLSLCDADYQLYFNCDHFKT
jgi:hypothetical protein